jgi:outer membrane protein assembly factor BamB
MIKAIKQFIGRRTVRIAALSACAVFAGAVLLHADPAPIINPVAPAAGGDAAAKLDLTDFDKKAAIPPTGDMTMWGGTPHRNMISGEKNPPMDWDVEAKTNIKWVAKLGNKAYGNPIVTNGLVIVGTNNESAYDKKYTNADGSAIDGGVLIAFDEKTGAFKWQKYFAKLPSGRVNDWPGEGLCSTVYSEKDRIWFCSNRCEVICLDITATEPREVWKRDMMKEYGVFPHNMTSTGITSYGDFIYVITGNGVDDTHKNVVAPTAPGIICFNKNTGEKVWSDAPAGENVLHGQWSSVAITEVKRADGTVEPLCIAPLGDGWVYAYNAKTGKLVWKFDSNPKDSIYPQTRNELIATPVIWENKMYIANGQDPEHSTGYAHFWCVDITKTGDVSAELAPEGADKPKPGDELLDDKAKAASRKGRPNPNSGVVWHFHAEDQNKDGKLQEEERMHRSICTVAIWDGLCFVPDFSGYLHCFDARTGKKYWTYDVGTEIWGSPLVCDGKLYLGDKAKNIHIFEANKGKDGQGTKIKSIDMPASVFGTPVMANGTMYILTMEELIAIQEKPK